MADRQIVCGTDFSEASDRALRVAAALAKRLDDALLIAHSHAASYTELAPESIPGEFARGLADRAIEVERGMRAAEREWLGNTAEKVRPVAGPLVATQLLSGRPALALLDLSHEFATRMLVVGTHGRKPPSRFFLGSVADRLLRTADVPVLVVRDRVLPEDRAPRVSVALSLSSRGQEDLLSAARSLAKDLGSELTIVHAYWPPAEARRVGLTTIDPGEPDPRIEENLTREIRQRFPGSEKIVFAGSWGRAADAVAMRACDAGDLLMIGATSGAFAIAVSRHCPAPILALPIARVKGGPS